MAQYIIVKDNNVYLQEFSSFRGPRADQYDAVFPYQKNKKVKPNDLADIAHNIAVMQESGLDILDSLTTAIASCSSPQAASLLFDVRQSMIGGASISSAFEEQSKWLPPMFLGVTHAGETSGNIGKSLFSVEKFYRVMAKIKDNINGQLIEPSITIVLSIGIALYLIGGVFPSFGAMITGMNVQSIPGVLNFFLSLSNYLPALIVGAVAVIVLFFRFREQFVLSMPIVGKQYQLVLILLDTFATAQILSIGFGAGLSLISIVDFIRSSVQSKKFKQEMSKVYEEVTNIKSLSEAFKDTSLPVQLKSIVQVGERSGKIKDMAESLSSTINDSIDAEMQKLEKSLFLGMMLITVVIVAPILFSFYYGYFGILNQVMQAVSQ